jgi:iron complex outermembrane receptor protein
MTKIIALAGFASILASQAALADETATADDGAGDQIVVTASRTETFAGTKTETPLIETPQPIKIVTEDQYLAQGAISISDTVKYTAGITANAYGRDTRVDGFVVRGVTAAQFRDSMRDIYSYYASITADPYNFSRVEIVRGPASVLFGQGSIGGLVNLVSKTPYFETHGAISAVYGSNDRKEILGDINFALADNLAIRAVGRARDSDTYVKHVPDDRVFIAPSIRWQPTPDTDITLLGLYQEDDTGSTSQFLPIVGTQEPNGTNPRLDPFLFVGKPGWDRYAGRTLQGSASVTQKFGENIKLNARARYIDSDLDYFTHYTDSYSNPANPYLDPAWRMIVLYADASNARMNVFSTDSNLQFKFNTGGDIEHTLMVGLDYSWSKVGKRYGGGIEVIDLYDIDYDALQTYPVTGPFANESLKQLGLYVQDQIRLWDRVSVVLGARRDRVRNSAGVVDKAVNLRAGIIGEIGAGFSPFVSYTESFEPLAMVDHLGNPLRPKTGKQIEGGLKWQPDPYTMVTLTGFEITENNRVIYGAGNTIFQSGELKTKGFEIEASRTLPGQYEILVNYGYNKQRVNSGLAVDFLPRHNASLWTTKTFGSNAGPQLRLGAGVVYNGERQSGPIVTGSITTVDALAEVTLNSWRLAINATNLFDERYFASCLSRGDCFVGAPRNVMATVGYAF